MSQQKGNSFLEMGRLVHPRAVPDANTYAGTIAAALREELGSTRRMIKTAMRWTGASEKTVKLWLAGQVGPSGPHLVGLARNSDDIFQAFLLLSQRGGAYSESDKLRNGLLIIARLTQELLDS
jgi:hypothetical protein